MLLLLTRLSLPSPDWLSEPPRTTGPRWRSLAGGTSLQEPVGKSEETEDIHVDQVSSFRRGEIMQTQAALQGLALGPMILRLSNPGARSSRDFSASFSLAEVIVITKETGGTRGQDGTLPTLLEKMIRHGGLGGGR